MKKVLLMVALLVLALPTVALAQGGLQSGAAPRFGNTTLSVPLPINPYIVTIQVGGAVDMSSAGAGCIGFTESAPSFNVTLNGAPSALRFFLIAEEDTTLAVRTPSGQFFCDDDSAGSLNPLVTIPGASTGTYEVWGGRFSQDTTPAYLMVTDSTAAIGDLLSTAFIDFVGLGGGSTGVPDTTVPDTGINTGALNIGLAPNYGSTNLAPGFLPDPFSVTVVSGNTVSDSVDASDVNSACRGFVTSAPDYVVNWGGAGSLLRVFFVANEDTTLVVQQPNGALVCDDDSGGSLNPLIDINAPAAGLYYVWVGSYVEGVNAAGTLYFTELTSVNPSNVPLG